MIAKKSLLVGAVIASVGIGGLGAAGIVSAQSANGETNRLAITERLAEKFNLKQSEVEAVFQEQHQERQAARITERTENIANAVTEGTLTQEQADYMNSFFEEADKIRENMVPGQDNTEVREQVREKMTELHEWADENDIDLQSFASFGNGRGEHARGKHGNQEFGYRYNQQ